MFQPGPTIINLNSDELQNFVVSHNKLGGSCDTIDDLVEHMLLI